MNKAVYNIALIGCGGMARRYRHKYTKIPGARLHLLIDTDYEELKMASDELGVENMGTDFDDCLAPFIDIVDISTPNHLHCQQAVKAMEAGKNVIIQKPLAPSIEEAELMVNTADKTGVTAGVYMNMLEYPVYHDIKDIIGSGSLGFVSSVYCRGAGRKLENTKKDNWRSSVEKTGGGAFIQKTIHFINLAQWLLEQRITKVTGFSKNIMSKHVGGDDITNAVCEFENGILGTLESSYISAPHIFAVYGTKGFVMVIGTSKVQMSLDEAYTGSVLSYAKPGTVLTCDTGTNANSVFLYDNPYDQHIAFVRAVMNGSKAPVPIETGLYDLRVVKAVYESSKTGKAVCINEQQ